MRIRPGLVAVLGFLALEMPAAAGPMSAGDRQRLVAHLEMTEAWLVSELEGLSDAQLPVQDDARELEHHGRRRAPRDRRAAVLEEPAGLAGRAGEGRLQAGGHRRRRFSGMASTAPTAATTGEARVPHGTLPVGEGVAGCASERCARTMLEDGAKRRRRTSAGVRSSTATMDVYQWFLMISTHSQRHILQIREIKAHASYPRR